ncbi:hypothetical protein ROZALSC1DRAFT_28298, partial [Rozella allomycis CSF55]
YSQLINFIKGDGFQDLRRRISNNFYFNSWNPQGELISNLNEHKSPLTCIAVSLDSRMFATADESGVLKIWDSLRLHFIGFHVIAIALDDVTLNIMRVECVLRNEHIKFQKLTLVKKIQMNDVIAIIEPSNGTLYIFKNI